jgi:hypothetical protein
MCKNNAEADRPQTTTRRMRTAYWIPKATNIRYIQNTYNFLLFNGNRAYGNARKYYAVRSLPVSSPRVPVLGFIRYLRRSSLPDRCQMIQSDTSLSGTCNRSQNKFKYRIIPSPTPTSIRLVELRGKAIICL